MIMVVGLVLVGAGYLLLSGVSPGASYLADLLPGYLAVGFGIGLVFVSVSVTSMADIDEPRAGLASGLITTAHEIGAALGVALVSTVALRDSGIVDGYGNGTIAAAIVAGVLALAAVLTVPTYRPTTARHVALH